MKVGPRQRAAQATRAEHGAAAGDAAHRFPVVGIGASAGGLEALQEFFAQLPTDTGCAYVVVTHMHREHTSMLPELLSKATSVPVIEAADGQRIEPNQVYVAPPGDNLTIDGGILRRREHEGEVRLPIDQFLRSLAADQRDFAICVIMSGTGTDGTLGLREVKGEAGMAIVQKPQSAKFAGMPSSAEATGLADFTLAPAQMPGQIVAYVQELRTRARMPTKAASDFPPDSLQQILNTLRVRTGHDFGSYKPNTIRRRVERRMNVHRIATPREYARYLKENKHEANLLFRELLITVTSFFRDPGAFRALAEKLSKLMRARQSGDVLRIWVPGCATGEEAYSVAIVVQECMNKLDRALKVQIFATDLDGQAIAAARAGVYAAGIAADVSHARLKRYFTQDQETYGVNKDIRELVVFAPHNVLSNPPFTRLDLIVCRNLLIYFDTTLQKKLLPTFHYALRPGGLLFLGPSETTGSLDDLFESVDRKWKIYRRKEASLSGRPPILPLTTHAAWHHAEGAAGPHAATAADLPRPEGRIQRMLLARFAPTCLVVEDNGNIVYVHGRTGLYLEPAEGEPSHNVLDMAREGLATPLATALRRAAQQKAEVLRRGVPVRTNSEFSSVDLSVAPIDGSEALRGLLLVTLRPSAAASVRSPKRARSAGTKSARVVELEEELRYSRESLQSTVEELEAANEELRSANEELQSMNEELHSSNEELETSKEEMQSLNEELSTVNAELNSKVEELSHANDDMQNLLNGIDVATVFLDQNLRIKRYTEQARAQVHLVPTDVGRPLADLALQVEHDLIEDCRQVLRTLERRDGRVRSKDGTWLMMRILPYRTSNNVIDGVVVTFMPIDELKQAEGQMQDACECIESILETVREPLVLLEENMTIRAANRAFCGTVDGNATMIVGSSIFEAGGGAWDIPGLRRLLEKQLPRGEEVSGVELEREVAGRRFRITARRTDCVSGGRGLISVSMRDVTS